MQLFSYVSLFRDLQEEYERLKSIRDQTGLPSDSESSPSGPQNRDSELLAEAKLLRQHKGRLEARMQVLEDHNRQLEAQLQRLRQLLDQVQFIGISIKFRDLSGKVITVQLGDDSCSQMKLS